MARREGEFGRRLSDTQTQRERQASPTVKGNIDALLSPGTKAPEIPGATDNHKFSFTPSENPHFDLGLISPHQDVSDIFGQDYWKKVDNPRSAAIKESQSRWHTKEIRRKYRDLLEKMGC